MADEIPAMIERLRRHCAGKPGAVEARVWKATAYRILNGQMSSFADFAAGDGPPEVLIRCPDSVQDTFSLLGLPLSVSARMKWDTKGWQWVDAPLDGSIPETTLRELLDASYDQTLANLDHEKKLVLDLLTRNLDDRALLDALIAESDLVEREAEIHALAYPSFLLRTAPVAEGALGPGQSRIGGAPDLPAGFAWPTHSSGKPLAFLAQIRFAELAGFAPELKPAHCPGSGVMAVFSVYGWMRPDDADPQLPDWPPAADWTRVCWFDEATPLLRRETPEELNRFPVVGVSFEPTLALPIAMNEPAVARLNWPEEVVAEFEALTGRFRAVRDHTRGYPHRHRLFGYADDDQGFPDAVTERELHLILQLGHDEQAEMSWGDDGLFDVWMPVADWAAHDFSRIVAGDQSG